MIRYLSIAVIAITYVAAMAVSVVTAYLESPDMMVVTDISDPENPKMVRYYKLESKADDILVTGNLIFIKHDRSIETLVVGENGDVVKKSEKDFSFQISSFDVRGKEIAVSYDGTIYIMDPNFKVLGTLSTRWKIINMRFLNDKYLVVNFGENGVGMVNVENPSDPRIIWRLEARLEKVVEVIPNDENLFAICESGMIFVVNVSDPMRPKVVKYTYLPENAKKGILYKNFLVVSSPSGKISVLDIADPFEPKLLFSKYIGTDVSDIDVVFGYIYVAKDRGMYIYKLGKFGLSFLNYVPAMSVELFARKRVSPAKKMPPGSIMWSYSAASEIRSAPMIMDDKIFFASVNGGIFSLDKSGKFLWSYRARFLITAPVVGRKGKVFVGSWDNYIYVVDESGNLVWRTRLGGDITKPVTVDEDRVYVGAEDGYLYAVENGKVVWKRELSGWMTTNIILYDDGQVVFGTSSGEVYAVSYSGNVLWKYDAGGWISSYIAADENGNVYFGTTNGVLFVVSKRGRIVWKYDAGDEISSGPVVDSYGRVIFGTRSGKIIALDREGNIMWTYNAGSPITSDPAVSKEGFLFFGTEDGHLYALNLDGTLRWKVSTAGKIVASPVVSKDAVYFGSTDGKIYAVYETTNGLDDGPWPMCCGNPRHLKVVKY